MTSVQDATKVYSSLKRQNPGIDGFYANGREYNVLVTDAGLVGLVNEAGLKPRVVKIGESGLLRRKQQVENIRVASSESAAVTAMFPDLPNVCVKVILDPRKPHSRIESQIKKVPNVCVSKVVDDAQAG